MKKTILIISAISGSGKSSVIKELLSRNKNYAFSISMTTRSKREGETDQDYRFISEKEFNQLIKENKMIEHVNNFNNYYGSSIDDTENLFKNHNIVIFDIDNYGLEMIKKFFKKHDEYNVIGIWLKVEKDEIIKRLQLRGESTVEERIIYVQKNYSFIVQNENYDYIIENKTISAAVNEIEKIVSCSE